MSLVVDRPKEKKYIVQGAKKSAKSSSGGKEEANTLASISYAKIVDLISAGEIYGLVNGEQSVLFDSTPLANSDGTYNFDNVSLDTRVGTVDQEYISGYASVETATDISTELTSDSSVTRTVTNTDIDAIRITLSVDALQEISQKTGDVTGYTINYVIELSTDGGDYQTMVTSSFSGKCTSTYQKSHRIDLPEGTSWTWRVRRLTANKHSSYYSDTANVVSVTEIIDAKMSYPMCALAAISIDSSQFSSIPQRAYHIKGRVIKVPANYDPETRTYATSGTGTSNGAWDGTFKEAWTDNPAWIYYDMGINDIYGLGTLIDTTWIDKWKLYPIAQYCDELVDDGQGGQEPRYTCNTYIQSPSDAYSLMSDLAGVFRGVTYYSYGQIYAQADMPADPVFEYNNSNVISGEFRYSGSSLSTRYTAALVSWNNPNNMYSAENTYVEYPDGVDRYGYRQTTLTAFGATSEGQAQRYGMHVLYTNCLEGETVEFKVGLDSINCAPGDIIYIADAHRAGQRMGGRIADVTSATVLTVDSAGKIGIGDTMYVMLPSGALEGRTINAISDNVVTLASALSETPNVETVWTVNSSSVALQTFRVVSLKEDDDNNMLYTITAVKHVTSKFSAIDDGSAIVIPSVTSISSSTQAAPTNLVVGSHSVTATTGTVSHVLDISWTAPVNANLYYVQYRRDDGNWVTIGEIDTTSCSVEGIYTGSYVVRVKASNAAGTWSTYTTSDATDIEGSVATPSQMSTLTATGQTMAILLSWAFPDNSADTSYTEIYYSSTNDFKTANLLTQVAYPTNTYTHSGLGASTIYYYWARLVNTSGLKGDWYPDSSGSGVQGTSANASAELTSYLQDDLDNLSASVTAANDAVTSAKEELTTSIQTVSDSVSSVKSDLTTVKSDLTTSIQTVSDAVTSAQDSISDLKTSVSTAQSDITSLQSTVKSDIASLQSTVDSDVTDLKQSISDTQSSVTSLQSNLTSGLQSAADDATSKADAAKDAAISYAQVIAAQVAEITGVGEWDSTAAYSTGDMVKDDDVLYRAIADVPAGTALTDTDYWTTIGDYASLGDAVSAAVSQSSTNATNIESLTTQVNTIASRMPTGTGALAASADVTTEATARAKADTALASRVTTIESRLPSGTDQLATSTAVSELSTTVSDLSDTVTSQGKSITTLQSDLSDLDSDVSTNTSALSSLTSTVTKQESTITSQGESITSLTSKLSSDETTIAANTSAITDLTSTVKSQAGSISSQSTDITALQNSLIGSYTKGDNLVTNADFAASDEDWLISLAEANSVVWDSASGDGKAGLTMTRTSSANPSIRPNGGSYLTVRGSRRYRLAIRAKGLSGAYNLMGRFYYRTGQATPASIDHTFTFTADGFSTQTYDYAATKTETDGVRFVVYCYPSNASVVIDNVGFYDVTDELATETNASAITSLKSTVTEQAAEISSISTSITSLKNSLTDAESDITTNSSAITTLDSRVTTTESEISSQSSNITTLTNSIGTAVNWRLTNFQGTAANQSTAGAPISAGLRKASSTTVVGSLSRGLNLITFNADSSFKAVTNYDTYNTAASRTSLADALNDLDATDYFILASQDNHSISATKQADLLTAIEACGGYYYSKVAGTTPYILLGRGLLGKGGGIEIYSTDTPTSQRFNDYYFTVIGGIPQGLRELAGLASQADANATAISSLTDTVTNQGAEISSISTSITSLTNELSDAETDITANSSAITKLDSRVTTAESKITSQSSSITSLTNSLSTTDKNVSSAAAAAATAQTTANSAVTSSTANATAISALQNTVTTQGDSITSQSASLTDLENTVSAGVANGSNMITDGGFEYGGVNWALGRYWAVDTTAGRSGGACLVNNATVTPTSVYMANANKGNPISVVPGRIYQVSCYYKVTSDWNGGVNSKLRVTSQVGNLLGAPAFVATATDWTKVVFSYTPPATGTVTGLEVMVYSDSTVGSLYVDDVAMFDVTEVTATNTAVSSLSNTVTSQGAEIDSLTSDITDLESSLSDATTNISANTSALSSLTTRVTTAEGKISSQASSITSLSSSLASVGGDNMLSNSSFETFTSSNTSFTGWTKTGLTSTYSQVASISTRGVGYAARVEVTPTATSQFAGLLQPIKNLTAGDAFTLSATMRGENCNLAIYLEWLNSAGKVGTSVVSVVSATTTAQRLTVTGTIPSGYVGFNAITRLNTRAADVGLDSWCEIDDVQVQAGSTATAWTQSSKDTNAAASTNASAITSLSETVTEQGDEIDSLSTSLTSLTATVATKATTAALSSLSSEVDSQADSISALNTSTTSLSASLGSSINWRLTNFQGLSQSSAGAPVSAGLRKASSTTVVGSLSRGLNLIVFNSDSSFKSVTNYDTYNTSANRTSLATALNALTASDYFILASQDNHSASTTKQNDLLTAIEACGGYYYADVLGTTPYILVGRGLLGKGGGIEVISADTPSTQRFLDYYFTVINGIPQGLQEQTGVTAQADANATAISTLSDTVTDIDDTVTSQGKSITSLTNRVTTAESDIDSNSSALTSLTSKVTSAQSSITSQAASITSLTASLAGIGGDNLLTNSSLEKYTSSSTTFTGWSPSYTTPSSVYSQVTGISGRGVGYAARIGGSPTGATNYSRLLQKVNNLTTGQTYTLSAVMRGENCNLSIYLQWLTSAGNTGTAPSTIVAASTTAQTLTLTATVPTGYTRVQVLVGFVAGSDGVSAGSSWCEIDDVQLQTGSTATAWTQSSADTNSAATSNASAITSLTATVSDIEDEVTTAISDITDLQTSSSTTAAELANALVIRASQNTVLASQNAALSTRMTTAEGKISSTSSALDTLTSEVSDLDDTVTSNTSDIKSLQSAVDNIEDDVSANSTAITSLQTTVTKTSTTVSSNSASITDLENTISAVVANGANMITDGSLTYGGADWKLGSYWSVASSSGQNGGACLINNATGTTATVYIASANKDAVINVTPGRVYQISCYYKVSSDWNGTIENSKLRVASQAGNLLGTTSFVTTATDWTKCVVSYTVPTSGSVTGLKVMIYSNSTVGTLYVDDVAMFDVTEVTATNTAVSALSSTVRSQGDEIDDLSTELTDLESSLTTLSTKTTANSSAITTLQSNVTSLTSTVTSQSSSITSLSSSLSSIGGDNLLLNSSFEDYTSSSTTFDNWSKTGSGGTLSQVAGISTRGIGYAARVDLTSTTAGQYLGYLQTVKGLTVGQNYTLSAVMRGANCNLAIYMEWVKSDGTHGTAVSDIVTASTTAQTLSVTGTLPTGYSAINVIVRLNIPTADVGLVSWCEIDDVQLQVGSTATAWSQSSSDTNASIDANASAISTLSDTVTSQGSEIDVLSSSITSLTSTVAAKATTSALSSLQTTVNSQGDDIDTLTSSTTSLSAAVGTAVNWRLTNHQGTDANRSSSGAPVSAGLRKTGSTTVVASLTRGLNLITFNTDSSFKAVTHYDTYSSTTAKSSLATALNALTASDYFILASQDDHGTKTTDLTAAIEACGGYYFADVAETTPYILLGRGLLGKGGGIEVFSAATPTSQRFNDYYFTIISGVPQGLRELAGITSQADANATAIDTLSDTVTSQGSSITALSTKVTSLQSSLTDTTTNTTANASAITSLKSTVTSLSSTVSSQATSITSLTSTVNSNTTSITNTQTTVDGLSARAGVTIDSNGYVTGWSLNNDGNSGEFIVLADKFQVQSSSTGARTVYSDGLWKVYDSNGVLRVEMGLLT